MRSSKIIYVILYITGNTVYHYINGGKRFLGRFRLIVAETVLSCVILYIYFFFFATDECNERYIVINHVTSDAITAVAPAAVGRTPSAAASATTDYNTQTHKFRVIRTRPRNETAAAVNVLYQCECVCVRVVFMCICIFFL